MTSVSTTPVSPRSLSPRAGWSARSGWTWPIIVVVLLACAALTGCGHSSRDAGGDPLLQIPVPTHVTVQTRTVAGLGPIVVDGEGHSLYMFPPDARSRVSCVGACAGTWPPLVIGKGDKPSAGKGIKAAALATLADPNTGALIVTYGGYPLYRYAGDVSAGTANGQGLFLNGGPWYVLNPDLQPVTTTLGGGA